MLTSLRFRLFAWYVGSLLLLAGVFFIAVHILALRYGTSLFIIIFLILAGIGFLIIYNITASLTYLTSRMNAISSKNLDERIEDIQSKDEIGTLAKTFNQLLQRINTAFKREEQFIADVAHEMKTPLATMRSSLEVALTKERTTEEYKKTIEEAIGETDRLSATLKDVLDLAWTEADGYKKPMPVCNISQLVEDIAEIAHKMATPKQIKVTTIIAKDLLILGLTDKLARAFLNIVDNAIKYTPPHGTIHITLEEKNRTAILTVADSGSGIAKEDLPHIFDRFYRGAKTNKVFGAGLGLAICQSIIALHKGTIIVESEVGKGSRVKVKIQMSNVK
jgi:two-component system, OmpR family, heavy metal sensor histidine kinase CusS